MNILSPHILRLAYTNGYFPMPDETGSILWYNPDPRAILPLGGFHCSRSLKKSIRKSGFTWSIDQDFHGVIHGCADRDETWITADIVSAYSQMFAIGEAHSVEIWEEDTLVGGLYGISLGGAFFAESMFHTRTNASKMALFCLVEHMRQCHMELLEVQFMTEHLRSLGVIEITSSHYMTLLHRALQTPNLFGGWQGGRRTITP